MALLLPKMPLQKLPLHKLCSLMVLLLVSAFYATADDKADLEAITQLEDSIESLALARGPFSTDLFDPLMALARLQLDYGKVIEAEDNLRRAQNIAHRNDGVYTTRQLPIIQLLTNQALIDEEYDEANQQQKFAFFVTRHAYDDNHPNILTAYADLADWFMQSGQPRRARNLLKEARALATETGRDPLPFAIMENKARRLEGICCNPKRLLEALEKESEEPPPETLTATYLEIADTLTLGGKSDQAAIYFRKAHEMSPIEHSSEPELLTARRTIEEPLSSRTTTYRVIPANPLARRQLERMTRQEQQEALEQKPKWFIFDPHGSHKGFSARDAHGTFDRDKRTYSLAGNPILFSEDQLDFILPLRWQRNKEALKIELTFTVAETGNLEDIEIVESNAPTRLNRLVISALKKAYYRPAMEAGLPVAREGVSLVQTFTPRAKEK